MIILGSFFSFKPAHNKTYNKICVTREDSDQPVHPRSMPRVLVYPSLDGTPDHRRLGSDCADTQAELSFSWSIRSYCRFYRALTYFSICCGYSLEAPRRGISNEYCYVIYINVGSITEL